ncbi:unnamed protein product [Aphanomyces euteiches]|nr:hypothetical protein AeRB84_020425 [Aphanomyces euteiches]
MSASRRAMADVSAVSQQRGFLRSLSTPLSYLFPLQSDDAREINIPPANIAVDAPPTLAQRARRASTQDDDIHVSERAALLIRNINADDEEARPSASTLRRDGIPPRQIASTIAATLPTSVPITAPAPAPAPAPEPPVDDSDFNTDEQLRTEMRQLFRRVQHILPFVVLFLLYFTYQHTKGIFVFIIGTTAIIALDQRFRAQVAMKDKASVLSLLGIVFICIIDAFAICSVNGDVTPFHSFLKPVEDVSELSDVLWAVMVNDFLLRLTSISLKAVIAIIKFEACCRLLNAASFYRRKRKLYAAVEYTTLLIRSAVASIPWCAYYQASSSKMVADLFTVVYLAFKGFILAGQVRLVMSVLSAALTLHLEYGTYVTPTELVEAGTPECSICYDTMQVPVQLSCSHMFCEECVSEWFDRERSCPLCRADVASTPDQDPTTTRPLYLDGGTSLFPQLL